LTSVDFEEVFQVLAEALPDFEPTREGLEDGLSHPFLNDMVRFVCDRAYPEYDALKYQFAVLSERLISEGDNRVHDLAHDTLDGLWEHRDERDVNHESLWSENTQVVKTNLRQGTWAIEFDLLSKQILHSKYNLPLLLSLTCARM
jgi:hypothetical protein